MDNYEINEGYAPEDLPPFDTLNQPDTLAIFTSDNSGTIIIDKVGTVHAFYGEMWVQDADTTDTGWTFYPGTSGLSYWNESFGNDSTMTIADAVDLNGNDTLDIESIANIGTYFMSLTSMPTASVDEDNRIYLIYSGVMEGEEYIDLNDDQHYRHLFLVYSEDGGSTWSEPMDLITESIIEDELFLTIIEAIAPSLVRDITDDLKFIYQQDFRPGWSTRGDMDPTEVNFINYVTISISDFIVGTEEIVPPDYFGMKLQPNPASSETMLGFHLDNNASIQLDLFNSLGQKLETIARQSLLAGEHQIEIKTGHLNTGMYILRMEVEGKVGVRKLIVEN